MIRSGYQRLQDRNRRTPPAEEDLESPRVVEESTAVEAPSTPAAFRFKILDTNGREHWIEAQSGSETIASVKNKLAHLADIPPAQQRLIYCGKMLQDGQTLDVCGIKSNNVVHLFARPAQSSGAATSGSAQGTTGVSGQGLGGQGGSGVDELSGAYPMAALGDPELMRATQSVKLFSSCLVAICAMQLLFLLLRLFGSWEDEATGGAAPDDADPTAAGTQPQQPAQPSSGRTAQPDDSALFFLQLVLNTLGIYVGLIGARSAHTLQPQAAKVYFYGLLLVGTLWISLRICWAVNVLNMGYDPEMGPGTGDEANRSGGGSQGGQNGESEPEAVNRSELLYMVCLSVTVYVIIWGICFSRASQFFRAVMRLSEQGRSQV